MRITPIAATTLLNVPASVIDTKTGTDLFDAMYGSAVSEIDALHEFAGRACYKSWSKPNPKTEKNEDYLGHIEEVAHFSILEHGQVSFYVEDVSRSLLLELERHERNSHLSFSVESQRYVNTGTHHPRAVIPPILEESERFSGNLPAVWAGSIQRHYVASLSLYDDMYNDLRDDGVPVKQAREAARAFLPNCTPVDFVVTADIRGWREVIEKRNFDGADKEIQAFAKEILSHLRTIAPASVQDLPDEAGE